MSDPHTFITFNNFDWRNYIGFLSCANLLSIVLTSGHWSVNDLNIQLSFGSCISVQVQIWMWLKTVEAIWIQSCSTKQIKIALTDWNKLNDPYRRAAQQIRTGAKCSCIHCTLHTFYCYMCSIIHAVWLGCDMYMLQAVLYRGTSTRASSA